MKLTVAFIIAACLVLRITAAEPQHNAVSPPSGWESWPLTHECRSALLVYAERNEHRSDVFLSQYYYLDGRTLVDVIEEDGTDCALVQAVEDRGARGWVATAMLVNPTRALLAKRAAEKLAKEKRDAAERGRAQHASYVASLPRIDNGSEVVFVGADRKCSEQFVQALSLDGLEKRKKIADLIAYRCGFMVDHGAHAKIVETQGTFCRVSAAEGKHEGESGWLPCAWVK